MEEMEKELLAFKQILKVGRLAMLVSLVWQQRPQHMRNTRDISKEVKHKY